MKERREKEKEKRRGDEEKREECKREVLGVKQPLGTFLKKYKRHGKSVREGNPFTVSQSVLCHITPAFSVFKRQKKYQKRPEKITEKIK